MASSATTSAARTQESAAGLPTCKKETLLESPSSIITLPNEMLLEIFANFLPIYPDCAPQTGMGSPVHLMLVCRRWNDIVVNTPSFWRGLAISDAWHDERILEAKTATELYLSRSRDHLISVEITIPEADTNLSHVLDCVAAHRGRWEYVFVSMYDDAQAGNFLGAAPNLLHLALFCVRLENDFGRNGTVANVPNLRSAVLFGLGTRDAQHGLPWSQLTSLTMADWSLDVIAPIFLEAVNLVDCRIATGDLEMLQVGAPKHLHALETLILEDREQLDGVPGTIAGFLDAFTAPSLLELQIPDCFLAREGLVALERLFKRSECHLQRLVVTGHLVCNLREAYECRFSKVTSLEFLPEHQGLPPMEIPGTLKLSDRARSRMSAAAYRAAITSR
ncbi:F-box domain-containing protein [Mycena kentingensis (nom. inval.)]|nr:F-box domain-containing protein [Mycena kentingensis (nom. inval.)]